MAEDQEEQCPIRAIVRFNVRQHLNKKGQQRLAETISHFTAEHDEEVIRNFPAMDAFKKVLVQVQEEKRSEFEDMVSHLCEECASSTPEEASNLYRKIANRLFVKPNFGRVAALVAFTGFAAPELAKGNGEDFVREVVASAEEDVDQRVHKWLEASGRSLSGVAREGSKRRREPGQWSWAPLAAIAGSIALVAAIAKS